LAGRFLREKNVIIDQKRKVAVLVGATLTAILLMGCGGKSEEDATTPVNTTGAGGAMPTANQMPPEVKARMEKEQADQKARAAAQGQAMSQGRQPGAPK
jgi:hypothetical protein